MNKLLAVASGVCLAAAVAVIAYILVRDRSSSPTPREDVPARKAPAATTSADSAASVIEKRVVADSLHNPCGVAVQPGTGHIFVSMVGRIVRIVPGDSGQVHDEIIGFASDRFGRGPVYEFGPLGLAFADTQTLVVGDGSQDDGKEIVRVYQVGSEPLPPGKARRAEQMKSYSTSIPAGEDSLQGEGNFFGVAIKGSNVFVSSNGDDTKGWVCKLELDLSRAPPLKLMPFIKTKELTDIDAPMGVAISPEGKLVVSQFGATNAFPDSLITYYNPATGKPEKKLQAGLRDLIAIAFSPKTGKLYGLDFSWAEPAKGGLFRLDIAGDQVRPVRLAALAKPTALAFAPDGTLYVTLIGSGKADDKKAGQVVSFDGL